MQQTNFDIIQGDTLAFDVARQVEVKGTREFLRKGVIAADQIEGIGAKNPFNPLVNLRNWMKWNKIILAYQMNLIRLEKNLQERKSQQEKQILIKCQKKQIQD